MTDDHHDIMLLRGKFIDLTIDIESILDDILAIHFCQPKRHNEFKQQVLEEMMFSRKIELFKTTIKDKYPKIFEQHQSHIDFKKLKDTRNKFAHNRFSFHTSKNGKTDRTKLTFHKTSDTSSSDTIELVEYEQKFEFFKQQLSVLSEILHKLSGGEQQPTVNHF